MAATRRAAASLLLGARAGGPQVAPLLLVGHAPAARPVPVPRAAAWVAIGRGDVSSRRAFSSPSSKAPTRIWSFDEVAKLVKDPKRKIVIVDAREPSELQATGHIPGAVNIPITSSPDSFHVPADEFADRFGFARPDKAQPLLFYCKAGVRSRAAAALAAEAGWKDVGEFPGSWMEWEQKGGEVER